MVWDVFLCWSPCRSPTCASCTGSLQASACHTKKLEAVSGAAQNQPRYRRTKTGRHHTGAARENRLQTLAGALWWSRRGVSHKHYKERLWTSQSVIENSESETQDMYTNSQPGVQHSYKNIEGTSLMVLSLESDWERVASQGDCVHLKTHLMQLL